MPRYPEQAGLQIPALLIGHLTSLEPSDWKLLGRFPIKINAFALKNDEIGLRSLSI
jgi:hypothetical protein